MAIDLKLMSRPKTDDPIMVSLFSEGGMGKTTLAAMFPKPVFIRTEDGTKSVAHWDDVLEFPVMNSTAEVIEAVEALSLGGHDRKTLVIDSVSQFERIGIKEILDAETNPKAKSMNAAAGGYGAAYGLLDKKHADLREACEGLRKYCGMNVVFILHATTQEMDLPDMDKYSRYSVAVHKDKKMDCAHHYTNNVDIVAFIRLQTNLRGVPGSSDKKRAISTGEREIICYPVASNVSKNRFGITEPLPFTFEGGNPFERFAAK